MILKKIKKKENNVKSNLNYGKCLLYFSLNKQAKLRIKIDNYFSLLMKFLDCVDLSITSFLKKNKLPIFQTIFQE